MSAPAEPELSAAEIASNLAEVRGRIAQAFAASGRSGPEPRLVAVSKTKSAASVRAAHAAGQRVFGENYVQELAAKAQELRDLEGVEWRFIGRMQSNKAKLLASVPNLRAVETVESLKHAKCLDKEFHAAGRTLEIMIQVNTSGEPQKGGLKPEEVPEAVKEIRETCSALRLTGLMTIGESGVGERDFGELVRTAGLVAQQLAPCELSMGMSGDFELAVRMGSTSVRVGSLIFGARHYPAAH
eukprot:m51a1_g13970 hypothetical protein (242) ;mRNA; f:988308-989087